MLLQSDSSLSLLQDFVDGGDLLLDLVLDARAAKHTEGAELDLGFLEFPEVGVPGWVQFGTCVLGSAGGEGADSFAEVAGGAGFVFPG